MSRELWLVAGGLLTAFVGAFFGWLASQRKTDVDESAVILAKWKELVERHEAQIERLNKSFDDYRDRATKEFAAYREVAEREAQALRERLSSAEKRIVELETDRTAMREENAQLKRIIAQNSQSNAVYLGPPRDADDEAAVAALDVAGHNSRKGAAE